MLTHLLILDTIMVIFFLLDSMTTNVFEQTPDWYIILYPYVIHPGKAIFVSATVFMVVAVSADRQRAICHSMLYRVSQKTNLTHIYLFVLLYNVLKSFKNNFFLNTANTAQNFSIQIYEVHRIFFIIFLHYLQPSPTCICIMILIAASLSNLPKFFEFYLIADQKYGRNTTYDIWTTDLNEDPRYIRWSSYNELITSGIFPLLALCYYNYEIYARIRMSCFIELGRYVGGKMYCQ